MNISIISASIRTGRKSPRVAKFFKHYLQENHEAIVEIIDLAEYNFPIFEERLKHQKAPTAKAIDFAEKIKEADGVLIVTPEYNGGYPAGLKNAVDLLIEEWSRKPIAISTVSDGSFGGTQVITSLQFSLFKLHALVTPYLFPVPKVGEAFDEEGNPSDKEVVEKRAATFVKEFFWMIEAKKRMAAG